MAINVPVGEAIVAFRYRLNGATKDFLTTLGVRPDDPARTPDEIAQDAVTSWISAGLGTAASMSAQYTFVGATVQKMTIGGMLPGADTVNTTGSAAYNPVPSNGAFLVKKLTPIGGKQYQGRMFVPPAYITEANIGAGGSFSGSDLTLLQAKFAALGSDLILNGLTPVLFHSIVTTSTQITSFIVDGLLATQRRRMR